MFKLVSILILVLVFVSSFISKSCSGDSGVELKASLNEEFRLPVNKTVMIVSEELEFTLEAVTADSRCPQGVTCIWAGEAKCQTVFKLNKNSSPLILTVSGGSTSLAEFQGYNLSFDLEPYPRAGETIDGSAYVMIMTISKAN